MNRIVLAAILGVTSIGILGEELPPCNEREVEYSSPALIPLDSRIHVRRLAVKPAQVQKESDPEYKTYSPQRTAAFNRVRIANTLNNGSRDNSIEIFTTSGKPHAWSIDVIDPRDNVQLLWLNEDLLFMRVWWGRIVSTDLIFELHSGKFIYAQEANYGTMVQPCNEPNPTLKRDALKRAP